MGDPEYLGAGRDIRPGSIELNAVTAMETFTGGDFTAS